MSQAFASHNQPSAPLLYGHNSPRKEHANKVRGGRSISNTTTERIEKLLDDLMAESNSASGVIADITRGDMRCLIVCEDVTVLSPRELEIARMVASGYPSKRIARTLEISGFTVDSHIRRIFVKLGVTTRAAMVARLTHQSLCGFAEDAEEGDGPEAHPSGT